MKELINSKTASLIDVRTEGEFQMGHVDGSINIPMDQVPNRVEEFKMMSKPLVLFCASGNRSGQVARYLTSLGITDIHNGGGWLDVEGQLEII